MLFATSTAYAFTKIEPITNGEDYLQSSTEVLELYDNYHPYSLHVDGIKPIEQELLEYFKIPSNQLKALNKSIDRINALSNSSTVDAEIADFKKRGNKLSALEVARPYEVQKFAEKLYGAKSLTSIEMTYLEAESMKRQLVKPGHPVISPSGGLIYASENNVSIEELVQNVTDNKAETEKPSTSFEASSEDQTGQEVAEDFVPNYSGKQNLNIQDNSPDVNVVQKEGSEPAKNFPVIIPLVLLVLIAGGIGSAVYLNRNR